MPFNSRVAVRYFLREGKWPAVRIYDGKEFIYSGFDLEKYLVHLAIDSGLGCILRKPKQEGFPPEAIVKACTLKVKDDGECELVEIHD